LAVLDRDGLPWLFGKVLAASDRGGLAVSAIRPTTTFFQNQCIETSFCCGAAFEDRDLSQRSPGKG
jgi:hypothetical protein